MRSDLIVGDDRIEFSVDQMKSGHRIPDQRNWWTPMGVNGDYYDLWERIDAAQLDDWTNTRGVLYYDCGYTDYSVEGVWEGNHGFTCFPIACINEDASEFGYTCYIEPDLDLAVLWELGRDALPSPGEIDPVDSVKYFHTDGVPVHMRLTVIGNTLTVYIDGTLTFTQAITANLQGYSVVGVTGDKLAATAPPNDINEGMAVESFKVSQL